MVGPVFAAADAIIARQAPNDAKPQQNGVRAPDERAPGTREKGSPEHDLGPVSKPPKA